MPMTLTMTIESAAAWWAHPVGVALTRIRNCLRPVAERVNAEFIALAQQRGLDWMKYHDSMKRLKDIAGELAEEEERAAVLRELRRRRAARAAAAAVANDPAPADAPAPAADTWGIPPA